MRILAFVFSVIILISVISCAGNSDIKTGLSIQSSPESMQDKQVNETDTITFRTRPGKVMLTGNLGHRLTPIFKLNYNKRSEQYYIGTPHKYYNYTENGDNETNNWNNNFMPGLEAVYGYNMVNVSLFNLDECNYKDLFLNPVVIKTLYFPSYSSDTLNSKPVKRNYYMVSVYDEDTNKDTFINTQDLRRFYCFNKAGDTSFALVPKDYSVISSQYDPANDRMFVYAQLDTNKDGKTDDTEPIHIFWIDLKNPSQTGILYQ